MYLRIAEPQIRTALRDTRVVAINGPRQSGKTTLARRFAKQGRKYITLDNQSTRDRGCAVFYAPATTSDN